ncbi:MAG: hypothetical protein LBJ17_09290 [Dysgonamonadaceae bacterium]|jgi:hypothetical protein|nr:hypothetical protein [Dysgonamonadaceae bacterium]
MKKLLKTAIFFITVLFSTVLAGQGNSAETLQTLANKYQKPSDDYRPHVWWHWLGSNFRKEGITKDLEAMKEAGIGGATIFNIASSVQNSHAPIGNNPWPEQTFRSPAYWDAFRHAVSEADRLGLIIGLHGTPGYATTGGPWITEERGMKAVISSKTEVESDGKKECSANLTRPELPDFTGYDGSYTADYKPWKASLYWDIAVMAVPTKEKIAVEDVIDISKYMDESGNLRWKAPKGRWTIYRYGYAPTMAHPHPLPDDIIGKTWEVDKMNREDNIYHWTQLLEPLKEHIGDYFGKSFTYIWIDSYESGDQTWTKTFRDDYIRIKGYDPVPWLAYYQAITKNELGIHFTAWESPRMESKQPDLQIFIKDYNEVKNRLFMDNGWKVAYEMLHKYGLKLYWEPYTGPFNIYEGTALADIPVNEFWSGSGYIGKNRDMEAAVVKFNKRIFAAEALTGSPDLSAYTEDPAGLKHTADGGFAAGFNMYFLHHWVHQPFDDKYQPAEGMGWWGTHFSRHQTWFRPGKAFFLYLARCQMLMQQGTFVPTDNYSAHRRTPEADIFFVLNPNKETEETYTFPVIDRTPELWNPYSGTISRTTKWRVEGDKTVIDLNLLPDESMIVVFPFNKERRYDILPEIEVQSETETELTEPWNVTFSPKLDKQFSRKFSKLIDFSKSDDDSLKYFSGTACYEQTFRISGSDLDKNSRVMLDLGELEDIAELKINDKYVDVLWSPPYKTDITPYIQKGNNKIEILVTNNWANRLIGDEQQPADFEWGNDAGERGHAMKAFPDWFIKNEPRPSQGRKAFNIWYYYRQDSPLQPAGLFGPVKLVKQAVSYR